MKLFLLICLIVAVATWVGGAQGRTKDPRHILATSHGHHYGQAKRCEAAGGNWLNIPPLFPAGCYFGRLR